METLNQLFSTRMNRVNFVVASLIQLIIFAVVLLPIVFNLFRSGLSGIAYWGFIFIFLLFISYNISIHIRRIHDINVNAVWLFLLLIPYAGVLVSVYLAIKVGVGEPNKFGPKDNSKINLREMFLGKPLPVTAVIATEPETTETESESLSQNPDTESVETSEDTTAPPEKPAL